ncbi:hypothetical protein RSAG8_05025, partial [Rhizoctonia solani AG-8 WAC10335]
MSLHFPTVVEALDVPGMTADKIKKYLNGINDLIPEAGATNAIFESVQMTL